MTRLLNTTVLAAALIALLAAPYPASASEERILDFESRIKINQDATIIITETIKVQAAGNQIKHGIYRDFPVTYKDRFNNKVKVGFQVLEVLRDGKGEGYHIKSTGNGQRVYIGRQETLLGPGIYIYTLKYATNRQIGYFADFDELYWNTTGNEWDFTIERAKAIVELPPGGYAINQAAYTGLRGEKGQNFMAGADAAGNPTFVTMGPLAKGEGLTIAVAWPKGIVAKPSAGQNAAQMLRDNITALAGLTGLLLVLAYYLYAWDKVGRDPPIGAIVPLYAPPMGFSPAATRFVAKMGFDDKAFAAAIVSMAVKGYLTINEDNKTYTLTTTGAGHSKLSPGENALAAELFSAKQSRLGGSSIIVDNANHRRINDAKDALKKYLHKEFEKVHFNANSKYLIPGGLLSLAAVAAVVLSTSGSDQAIEAAIGAVFCSGWLMFCFLLFFSAYETWRLVFLGDFWQLPRAIFFTLLAVSFIAFEVVVLFELSKITSMLAVLFLAFIALLFPLFYKLLKAPTITGRKVMDQIEGFKMYMAVAEKDRLNMLHPPDETPELFEKNLPFALALDVEQQWCERFASVFAGLGENDPKTYRPGWHGGQAFGRQGVGGIGQNLGSAFAGALASAATAPGSSSGSGGGGSSGGGGGGGGGGGW